jgi:hypothetical protein
MIKSEKPTPKFIHRNTRDDEIKFDRMFREFAKIVKNSAVRQIKNQKMDFNFDPKEEVDASGRKLLELRKQLIEAVREGMLERKDQEEKIALLAALIWFNRQDVEHKARILAEWG